MDAKHLEKMWNHIRKISEEKEEIANKIKDTYKQEHDLIKKIDDLKTKKLIELISHQEPDIFLNINDVNIVFMWKYTDWLKKMTLLLQVLEKKELEDVINSRSDLILSLAEKTQERE